MKQKETDLWRPRNPITHRRIRREVFWQITLPIVVTLVLVIVFSVLSWLLPPASAGLWADISLIWLITPTLVMVLIMAVITAAGAYAVIRLIDILPPAFFKAQTFFRRVNHKVDHISDQAARPIVRAAEIRASWQALKIETKSAAKRVVKRSS